MNNTPDHYNFLGYLYPRKLNGNVKRAFFTTKYTFINPAIWTKDVFQLLKVIFPDGLSDKLLMLQLHTVPFPQLSSGEK